MSIRSSTSINPALTTPEALKSWLLDWHATTAQLDAKLMADKFFTSDISATYGNTPPLKGKEAVQASFEAAFAALDYMHHDIEYFDLVEPDHIYQVARIEYVIKGDTADDKIVVPAMWSAWLVEQSGRLKVRRSEIYIDASAVFGRMTAKGLIN